MAKFTTMQFGQLSNLYFPQVTSQSARKKLMDWTRSNHSLQSTLRGLGWKAGCRKLTPKMVMLIMQHLGEP